jgi:Raf kinase inhibitor-like YbhB/YbcL family protein
MNQPSLGLFAAVIVAAGVLSARAGAQGGPAKLTVTSTAFKSGETIPAAYTADGRNVSPPLAWTGAPAGTREFALILDDPDAPTPQPFVHWVIYKIPGAATGLPEGVPMGATVKAEALPGAIQGATGFSAFARRGGPPPDPGYRGPAPPAGKPHHYHFKVYALNAPVEPKEGMTKDDLLKAMEGKIIAQGEIIGVYERKAQK